MAHTKTLSKVINRFFDVCKFINAIYIDSIGDPVEPVLNLKIILAPQEILYVCKYQVHRLATFLHIKENEFS